MINPAEDIDLLDEYAFGDNVVKTIPEIKGNIWPTANQGINIKTRNACTIVWAISQLQRLFQLDMTQDERNKLDVEIVEYCQTKWYIVGTWWSTYTACKTVVERWNNIWAERFWKEKVFYLRILWNNPLVMDVLKKGHLVGYTKKCTFGIDQYYWYVYRDSYPEHVWHRLNLKWTKYTLATWWAEKQDSKYWSQDNYHWQPWENFFIKDIATYINKELYSYVYIILPMSAMEDTTEEQKKKIATLKAVNATIWVMTTTWSDMDEKYKDLSAMYAKALREAYPEARELEKDQAKKCYQSVVDMLSYAYKYADAEEQKTYATLAEHLREKFNLL